MDAKYAMDPKQFPWKLCKEIGSYLACYDGKIYQCKVVDDNMMEADEEGRPVYHEVESKEAILRWNALCENTAQPEEQLIGRIADLNIIVKRIQKLYETFPSMEDTTDISILTPLLDGGREEEMTENLNEWQSAIIHWLEEANQAAGGVKQYKAI